MNEAKFFVFLFKCMENAREGERRAIRDNKPEEVIKYQGIQKMIEYINNTVESGEFNE